ncbi:universal stress protein [Bacillus massiliglaciei]|uniref:universal stress protein n=1 Tax=Bacillus massiliglaciei TaxID=1816693 RepID=UPI000A901976|nr:universal stress protein [Bacillus massiliglaciei]
MNQLHYRNILVAFDGSEEAEWAVKKGIAIATQTEATLVLAHVIDARNFPTVESYDLTLRERAEREANDLMGKYELEAEKAGVHNVVTAIEVGSPKTKIPRDLAKEYHIDLIVCGATGLNAVERFLIGSVSEGIVRHSHCDVLVVRTQDE